MERTDLGVETIVIRPSRGEGVTACRIANTIGEALQVGARRQLRQRRQPPGLPTSFPRPQYGPVLGEQGRAAGEAVGI
jgi:hypothetical protein